MNISIIKELINKVVKESGLDSTKINTDEIYYLNGNDGTDFDYQVNGDTCEFMLFYNDDFGALKCFVDEKNIKMWVYKEKAFLPFNEYTFRSPFKLSELCGYLYGSFDMNDIWDEPITDWELSKYVCVEDDFDNIDDEDEDYDDLDDDFEEDDN